MKERIIVLRNADIKKVMNVKGYIEMRLSPFGRMKIQLVDDAHTCVIFHIRTTEKKFAELKTELDELFPGSCVYLQHKEGATA